MAADNWSQSHNSWSSNMPKPANQQAVWGDTKHQNKTHKTTIEQQPQPKKDGFGMFIDETQFPKWDD